MFSLRRRLDRQPGWRRVDPGTHSIRCSRMQQLASDSFGNGDAFDDAGQQGFLTDEHQIVQRPVSETARRKTSQAEAVEITQILHQVCMIVISVDASLLQKGVERGAGAETEEAAQFGLGQPPGPELLDGESFQARRASASPSEPMRSARSSGMRTVRFIAQAIVPEGSPCARQASLAPAALWKHQVHPGLRGKPQILQGRPRSPLEAVPPVDRHQECRVLARAMTSWGPSFRQVSRISPNRASAS